MGASYNFCKGRIAGILLPETINKKGDVFCGVRGK